MTLNKKGSNCQNRTILDLWIVWLPKQSHLWFVFNITLSGSVKNFVKTGETDIEHHNEVPLCH